MIHLLRRPILLSIVNIILFSSAIIAQEKTISQNEYERVKSESVAASFSRPYRSISKSLEFRPESPSEPTIERNIVVERVDATTMRQISFVKENGRVVESERITIGKGVYVKVGTKGWEKNPTDEETLTVMGNVKVETEEDHSYRFLGERSIVDVVAKVYEHSTITTFTLPRGEKRIFTQMVRLWIGPDGKRLRNETRYSQDSARTRSETDTTYEYPVEIKIEAPIP